MQQVLVTGGSGILGRALQRRVADDGTRRFVFWSSRDCDLTDERLTRERIGKLAPDAILNLATVRGGVGGRRPASQLRANLLLNLNVLEAAREHRVAKVVLCLSNGMYGPDAPLPLREADLHHGPPHTSNYAYAFAKRAVEPMVRAWREEHGMVVVGASPNGLIGEDDFFHPEEANMTAALIRRIHEARDGDGPIRIWGDGTVLRELSDSADVARDLLWVLDHYDAPEVLNLGTDEEVSVRTVAETIAGRLGVDRMRLHFDASAPGGAHRRPTDTSRWRSLSGARYRPFRETLEHTVAWYERTAREAPERIRGGPPRTGGAS